MIDGENFFDQRVKIDIRTYHNFPKNVAGQGDDTQLILYWITHNKMIDSNRVNQTAST